jgi:transcription antitermination factor NusG
MLQSQNLGLKWYILYTYPNYEKKILKVLTQKNIFCFLPTQRIIRQWSDRKKTIEVPLFPNYLFVYTTNQERVKQLDISGVARYVTHCGKPVTVSQQEIEIVEKMVAKSDISVESDLIERDIVKIVEGPFTGLEGIFFQRKGRTRVGVKIEAMNQFLCVEVDISYVQKIN